jgi:hypothetical protein
MRAAILALALMAIPACTTVQGSRVVCPTLTDISPALQTKLAEEVEEMARANAYHVARYMLRDYAQLRAQVRACRGE